LVLATLADLGGVGTTGELIGTTVGWFSTTTLTSLIAGPSSIAATSPGGISIAAENFAAAENFVAADQVTPGNFTAALRSLTDLQNRTAVWVPIPARSAALIMGASLEVSRPAEHRVSAAGAVTAAVTGNLDFSRHSQFVDMEKTS
jgi:Na+/H+-dicarboxylate symporter